VEAPAAFTLAGPGTTVVASERLTMLASHSGAWTAVQRIRLREEEIDDAVEAVRSFMRVTGTTIASWWLSERSTPRTLEERLLAAGLHQVEGDYLIDGLLLTNAPPAAPPGIEARPVASAAEYVAASEAQYEAFGTPTERRHGRDLLTDEYELVRDGGAGLVYCAWLDGELSGAGRAWFAPRGVLLSGGCTLRWARSRGVYRALVRARWEDAAARGTPALAVQAGSQSAPILRRLGFEKICRFRRLEDVASTG